MGWPNPGHMNERTPPYSAPKLVASLLGIGYLGRGSGTVAAGVVLTALCAIGVVASTMVENEWGVDSGRVVVDEAGGMAIALIGLPGGWPHALAAFVLFRVLDIAKPLGISQLEKLPGGWGVMGDDVLAGIYTNLILQTALLTGIWPT